MSETTPEISWDDDDTEGHSIRKADAEQAEGDDTEGHMFVQEERSQAGRPD